MLLRDLNTIEQVSVEFIVEICGLSCGRVCEMICSCPQNLIGPTRRPVRFWLDECLIFLQRRWWGEVRVSVKVVLLKLDRLDLHSLNFFEIFLVIQTIAENITKCAQRTLQAVCCGFFLRLLE